MQFAPEEVRQVVANAIKSENKKREELISKAITNISGTEAKRIFANCVWGLPMEDLELLCNSFHNGIPTIMGGPPVVDFVSDDEEPLELPDTNRMALEEEGE